MHLSDLQLRNVQRGLMPARASTGTAGLGSSRYILQASWCPSSACLPSSNQRASSIQMGTGLGGRLLTYKNYFFLACLESGAIEF